jgi:F-type H+-transporting ATPase subunit gamma
MKALAASSIGQYEKSVSALADYSHTVELGLAVCLRESRPMPANTAGKGGAEPENIGAVIFGSDQGLVGQFNEVLVDFALKTLASPPGTLFLLTVGERVASRLTDQGLPIQGLFSVPNSVKGISPLVGRILLESENISGKNELSGLYLFYNRPQSDLVYTPVSQRLLPLDETWRRNLANFAWPTRQLPEVLGSGSGTLRALIREYLFVSLFRACAESLASENASRLAAMQRAEKNIEELLEDLDGKFHRLRQSSIDEELFDVISGFEALSKHSA